MQLLAKLHTQLLSRIQTLGRSGVAALAIVLAYTLLALATELGTGVAGQGLDPVWSAAQARGTLRVAVDYGFQPFTDIQGTTPRGYDIDLARAVAQKLGLQAEFVPSGLDSIYDDLAAGKADLGASALPYAPEQGWRVSFSEFYFNAGQVLVVRQGSPIVNEGALAGRRVGVALGSDADSYARALAKRVALSLDSSFDTPAAALTSLRSGTLDAVITDNVSALIAIGGRPGLTLVAALTLEPYTLVVPAPAFRLHSEVNRALVELRREGFFEQNGARWFVEHP
jgi:polar amino acid transport system substrate-binding protein